GTEALVAAQRRPSSVFDWCVTQGMHITGTKTPWDFLTRISQHSLEGILHNVKQDILLTEGEQDHLFDIGWIHRVMKELVCARSVTARIFTEREGGEQHCQVGKFVACARGNRVLAAPFLSRHAVDQIVKLTPLFAGALSAAVIAGITVWTFAHLPGFWVWAAFIGWASYDHSGANRKALFTSSACSVFGVVMAWLVALVVAGSVLPVSR